MRPITITLTCSSKKEADSITKVLIDNKLAACVKKLPVTSTYWWNDKQENSEEVLLIIETLNHLFSEIEESVRRLHSYKVFVLNAYNIDKSSDSVDKWLRESLDLKYININMKKITLYTDGGSRGNPGESACAYVICNPDGSVVEKSGFYLSQSTNNKAEYEGLIMGIKKVKELGVAKLQVFMDSELIVNQLNGKYKVKNQDLLDLYKKVKALTSDFVEISFSYVPRRLNQEADGEVNRILDEHTK